MPTAMDELTLELVEKVIAIVRRKVPREEVGNVERFIRQYYHGVAGEDLAERDPQNLYGTALAHWSFARKRKPGESRIQVYNPRQEQHGWISTHTIIETVCENMPFIVDSVRMGLNRLGLTNHLVIHPVMSFRRDKSGLLLEVMPEGVEEKGIVTEALMHVEVDRQTEAKVLGAIQTEVERVFADVRAAVEDWTKVRAHMREALTELADHPPPIDAKELAEAQAFLEWMEDNHFTFLGYREYELLEEKGEDVLRWGPGPGLGVMRGGGVGSISKSFAALPAEVRKLARKSELLIITKANHESTVHRPGFMDYVGVKRLDKKGRVIGERRFVGLYTSSAYQSRPADIPLLRHKVTQAVETAGFPRSSHTGKALMHILDTFPRDELFHIPGNELLETALGILHLQERQRIRLFIHKDLYGRFFSCIIFVPRDRFNTAIRKRIQTILEQSLEGKSYDFSVQLTASVLARLYFMIRVPQGSMREYDVKRIEARLVEVTRVWKDDFHAAVLEHCGEERGTRLYRCYGDAFRADYQESYSPQVAVSDVEKMEALGEHRGLCCMSLYRPMETLDGMLRFKLFQAGQPIPLSDALPMLEHMGLRVMEEHPSIVKPLEGAAIWIHDFVMEYCGHNELELERVREPFQAGFERIWHGEVESDGLNRLILGGGLSWREVVLLRAYCKYLRQIGVTFSQTYIEQALSANGAITALLVRLFHVRFDPDARDGAAHASAQVGVEIEEALDRVSNLDEDRILRCFLGAIRATLRTDYYQLTEAGEPRPSLSFKFNPALVPQLPEPKPQYEIFVYSPRVEGVHLRGGKIARGGIRWSDRREDFRTEVLGLVKAQMVKNAVIVPVGAKGGFVPKAMPAGADREATMEEGIACYQLFIRGLLAVTDNIVDGEVVPPARTIRYDEDDPYLVVAADKGTASFSDIANSISLEQGFWLGDAFASGGSVGYDHKGMGITARGAWESVKRHFREIDVDTQSTDFNVVGIGDMAGDVFGNGMLRSPHTKLVAAFNHLSIFFDPDPDPKRAYAERERLFNLPRSGWDDYNTSLISAGGGVFSRSAKSIKLSPEVQKVLDVEETTFTPNALIREILKAPVDLLWNGGIGTYVKASSENDGEVGDRANDSVRIDGKDLRCKVVGEGGNLGFTQRGRIEYSLNGGRIITDSIDNSAGVDCSDHEVNIKILLNAIVAKGELTEKQRNRLLAEMTDEVGVLVLRHNYLQNQALSIATGQALPMADVHLRLMQWLEREGGLRRDLEFLPGREELADRAVSGAGLSPPELSLIFAYYKNVLSHALLQSNLPEDPFFFRELEYYFPVPLRERYRDEMPAHRLWREIICTVVANGMVNRAGMTFAFRLGEETGASHSDIARAFMAAREIFGMRDFWSTVDALDNKVPASVQKQLLLEGRKLVERGARWLLRNRPMPLDVAASIACFSQGAKTLEGLLGALVPGLAEGELWESLHHYDVLEGLIPRVAGFDHLFSALGIVEVASSSGRSVEDVARVHFQLGARLELDWLRTGIVALPRDNRWQALARAALHDEHYAQHSALTASVLAMSGKSVAPKTRIDRWLAANGHVAGRYQQVVADLMLGSTPDFSMLSVAMGELRNLRHCGATQGVKAEDKAEAPKRRGRKKA